MSLVWTPAESATPEWTPASDDDLTFTTRGTISDTAVTVAADTLGILDPDTIEAAVTEWFTLLGLDQAAIDTALGVLVYVITDQPTQVHQALVNVAKLAAVQAAIGAAQGLSITAALDAAIAAVTLTTDLQAETAAHAIAYADTADVFELCGRSGADLHDDRAWKNGPAGEFTTGYWCRSLIWVDPFYRDGATDGEIVFSEFDTQTHDAEVGSWDNRERAILRVWSAADARWRNYTYFEATPEGGTREEFRIFPNNATPTGEFAYDVDLYTGWEIPEGQWVELACWFDFTGGPAGVWRHRELVRAIATEPDVILDGTGWRVHYDCHGDIAGSIDTGVTEPWAFGLDQGAIRMAWMDVGDGPAGTVYANPTAAGAIAADPAGVSAFTDAAGNEWTPEVDALARTISSGGGGVALGETSTTAYRGDRGKTAYDYSQAHTGATDPHGDRAYAAALVDDLSGVSDASTARTYLGLGTAATTASSDYATAAHTHTGTYDPAGAAAAAQAAAVQRANHTGTQAHTTITGLGSLATLSAIPNNGRRIIMRDGYLWDTVSGAQAWQVDVSCAQGHGFIYGEVLNGYTEWTEWLDAGTWTLECWYLTGSSSGVITLALDGSTLGATIEGYSASTVRNLRATRTGITVATSGLHTLRASMLSKHASSSGYRSGIQAVHWRRTA